MSTTEAGAAGGKDVEIVFHGAATTVTGSCMLMRLPGGPVLVDCGLFQGPKALQALNYARLPVDAGSLAAAILTHAHIDHAGMFPRLVREGFWRRAFSTAATCDLLAWVLTDAGAIHESEAERLNRRNRKRGAEDVKPLYTVEDAERSLGRLAPVAANAWFEPVPGTRAAAQCRPYPRLGLARNGDRRQAGRGAAALRLLGRPRPARQVPVLRPRVAR